jgi:chemotaxis protein histidine kinase CheA
VAEIKTIHRERLEELKKAYRSRLRATVEGVVVAAREVRKGETPEAIEALFQAAHRLAGSSAIYGFQSVSDAAGAVEAVAIGARSSGHLAESSSLERLLDALQSSLDDVGSPSRKS